jgi:acyl-CoA thioesterase FadM
MNLFLRLIMAWYKGLYRPTLSLLDECVSDFQVWFTDQDAFRHMTNSRYFSLTDVSIVDYMLRIKAWPKLRKKGWMPHIMYEDMAFLKPLRWGHRFVIKTRFLGWDDKHVVAQHIFERKDGKICAEGYTVARFVSLKGEKLLVADVLTHLGFDTTSPQMPQQARDMIAKAVDGYRLKSVRATPPMLQAAE